MNEKEAVRDDSAPAMGVPLLGANAAKKMTAKPSKTAAKVPGHSVTVVNFQDLHRLRPSMPVRITATTTTKKGAHPGNSQRPSRTIT